MELVNDKLDDEFFIIDSNNLNSVKQRLYGFTLQNDEIIQDKQMNDDISLKSFGSYVFVNVTDDNIIISQDFNGCYGLYVL